MEENSSFDSFENLALNPQSKSFLAETAKWAYFLSILGFIGMGIMVLFGLFFGSIMGSMPVNPYEGTAASGIMGYMGIIYVIMALIYFFPILYLFKFSKKMKSAISSNNNEDLTEAFLNLKSHYKYIGIFTVIMISFYVLMFLVGLLGFMA